MTKASAVNFANLDTAAAAEVPYEFELENPGTKEPLGVFVSVIGTESTAFKNRTRRQLNADRRREFEMQRKGKHAEPKMIEQDEADTISMCVDLMRGWRTVVGNKSEPVIIWGDEKLEFNEDNAERWITQFSWTRLQIIAAAGDVGNFLKN